MTSAISRLSYLGAWAVVGVALATSPLFAAGYLKFGDIKGRAGGTETTGGSVAVDTWAWGKTGSRGANDKWFIADSFGFGVEREMKESGERGGTEDINIGVGELQEATVSKSMDRTSTNLAQHATIGSTRSGSAPRGSLSVKVPAGSCKVGARYPTAEFGANKRIYTMTGVVVTHCAGEASAGSRPTETLSLNFDKITWKYWP